MKRYLFTFLMCGLFAAQAQNITMPQASPTQTVKQNFGVGSIELSYSRPALKGRTLGTDLAPYGQVWRTGANGATVLQFSDDVTIGGTAIKAGKYGLLSIPDAKDWTLIITKDLNINNPSLYKQENDVVRVKAPVTRLTDKVETFTIDFENFTGNSCDIQLKWGNTLVTLPVTTSTDDKVMQQINDIFGKDTKPYFAAARYYFENGKDIAKAKEWIDKAAADPNNAKALHVHILRARIYQKAGDKKGAKAIAEKVLAQAKEAGNNEYIKTAQDIIKSL